MSKIYIAGKVTGSKEYKSKFALAEEKLKKLGHDVLNPTVLPSGLSPKDAMRVCFAMIDIADNVVFLEDAKGSKGAKLEKAYCDYVGIPTIGWEDLARGGYFD